MICFLLIIILFIFFLLVVYIRCDNILFVGCKCGLLDGLIVIKLVYLLVFSDFVCFILIIFVVFFVVRERVVLIGNVVVFW